jgi:hypothetical protein
LTLPIQTQIMKDEFSTGYTATMVTNATGAPAEIVVKATPGKVARILVVTGAINVTPVDGVANAWTALTSAAELNLAGTPMQFVTDIRLQFSANGSAWILYK